jgi:hypothetical protein
MPQQKEMRPMTPAEHDAHRSKVGGGCLAPDCPRDATHSVRINARSLKAGPFTVEQCFCEAHAREAFEASD